MTDIKAAGASVWNPSLTTRARPFAVPDPAKPEEGPWHCRNPF